MVWSDNSGQEVDHMQKTWTDWWGTTMGPGHKSWAGSHCQLSSCAGDCPWTKKKKKKRSRVRKHVDPEETRESTESKLLFLSFFKPSGKQRAASTNSLNWCISRTGWASSTHSRSQSLWPSGCSAWASSRQQRSKVTCTSRTPQSC